MSLLKDPHWYRVAGSTPRLRAHLRVQRRLTRGNAWYLLADDDNRRYQRVAAAAWQFIGRLDGHVTVDAAWRAVHDKLGEAAPTQAEVVALLTALSDAELLVLDADGDGEALLDRRQVRRRSERVAAANPLFFKLPLFDPSARLARLGPLARFVFGPIGATLWLTLVGFGSGLGLLHHDELAAALSIHAGTPGFLLRVWITYPLIKALHEAGHALAVRRWGGEVREVGIHIVMLTPLPYVDASAATGFRERHRRMLVSAAGVMVELGVAAAAICLWAASSSEPLRLVALAVGTCCGVSTLLFNANPLARFDGYHLLTDAVDMPNLQRRGRAMVGHLARRLACGRQAGAGPEPDRREATFVALYALAAWVYQGIAASLVAFWLAGPAPWAALMVAVLAAWSLVLRPAAGLVGLSFVDGRLNGRRLRATAIGLSTATVLAALVFVVRWPSSTVQQGVVWAPPEAVVRTEAEGDLVTLTRGSRVSAGQVIATLDNLSLRSQRAEAVARARLLDVKYTAALPTDAVAAATLALERAAQQARLRRIDDRIDHLVLRAGIDGELVVPRDTAQPGRLYPEGREFGYIVSNALPMRVKVALTEAQAALVRTMDRGDAAAVSVRLASAPNETLPARIDRETPGVTHTLPSELLGSGAGGPIAVDATDAEGRRTIEPVAVMDVRVTGRHVELIGARAWVRFEHPPETLARQCGRWLQQAFIGRMGGAA